MLRNILSLRAVLHADLPPRRTQRAEDPASVAAVSQRTRHGHMPQFNAGFEGGKLMMRHLLFGVTCAVLLGYATTNQAEAQQAFARSWGTQGQQNWERFYHYPYVYYPHNFRGNDYYRSADSMYYRYPQEMRIPVYNRKWYNYYPSARLYHRGHHFQLDVF